jgi:tetratricopeptide (TPR) repeat protein
MVLRRIRLASFFPSILPLCVLFLFPAVIRAQPPASADPWQSATPRRSDPSSLSEEPVDVNVSVREPNGMPLDGYATVTLSSTGGLHLTSSTEGNSTAKFSQILPGEYDIEVSAAGYKTVTERASVFGGGSSSTVYLYLHKESEGVSGNAAPGGTLMTPRLQAEVDKGLDKMRRHQYDTARVHFDKAAKMAPGNPDIQYLLGILEYAEEHFDAARAKFKAALAIYPSHERSLLSLGELELRTGDAAGAAQTLEKAYEVNGADWRTHWLLANAYFEQKEYGKALPHAKRAAELGKDHAAPAWMLLGEILVREEKREEAKRAFETIVRSFPNDPAVPEAKKKLAALDMVAVTGFSDPPQPQPPSQPEALPLPTAPAAAVRSWAPPDIDSKEYPAAEDVACSERDLVERTQTKMMRQLGNFEKFLATEHIEHQEVDANGIPGTVREKEFDYLIFVKHPRPGMSFLEEKRDGGENLGSFPTSLATQGLAALALSVFDPHYEGDLIYKCEGLGTWRGKAVWRLRFEQKREAPSRIRLWENSRGTYPIPLKGRVWIAASSYDVLHIETDLREPVKELDLTRDHLVIDYGPVHFEHSGTTLWLPWDAEMFMELRGKRYHHTHTLRNYMLFSVETGNAIAKPKQALEQEQQ